MKRKFLCLLVALLMLAGGLSLVGCDGGGGGPSIPDYNADIKAVAPEDITTEHFVAEENTTYYTSPGFSLWVSVNGEFLKIDYFSLDGDKRIYDNLYFYEEDYFYIVTDDYKDLYASLGDTADTAYAEEEKEEGYDIQINIKKAGKYKLVFDTKTLKFDMEYKAEIETPVYYTIKNCSIYTNRTNWIEMAVNPDNEDEFVMRNFSVNANEFVCFYNNIHTSNYKVTLDESCDQRLASARKTFVTLHVGGTYDIYINKKTYVVRLELLNPDTASYSCVYYDGESFIPLSLRDAAVPYIFCMQLTAEKLDSLPDFHTEHYRTYRLTSASPDTLMGSGKYYYFKQAGTYNLIVNLKTFEVTAELVPQ